MRLHLGRSDVEVEIGDGPGDAVQDADLVGGVHLHHGGGVGERVVEDDHGFDWARPGWARDGRRPGPVPAAAASRARRPSSAFSTSPITRSHGITGPEAALHPVALERHAGVIGVGRGGQHVEAVERQGGRHPGEQAGRSGAMTMSWSSSPSMIRRPSARRASCSGVGNPLPIPSSAGWPPARTWAARAPSSASSSAFQVLHAAGPVASESASVSAPSMRSRLSDADPSATSGSVPSSDRSRRVATSGSSRWWRTMSWSTSMSSTG